MLELLAFLAVLVLLPLVWWMYGSAMISAGGWFVSRVLPPLAAGVAAALAVGLIAAALGTSSSGVLGFAVLAGIATAVRAATWRQRSPNPSGLSDADEAWHRLWGVPRYTPMVPALAPSVESGPEKDEEVQTPPVGVSGDPDEESLKSLRQLRDAGVLSVEEFQRKVLDLAERAGR